MTAPRKIWRAGTLTYTTGGLVLLCFWLLWGDFPWAMKDRAVGPSATLLIKQLGVSDFLYGLIIVGFPNFTNTFLLPAISYISDRHRGRWGRRIPFLLFTTPFIVFGIYLMGLTHLLGGWLHEGIPALPEHHAKLIVFCIGWILLDFGATLSASLFNALANDVVPKEVLGRFFALFRMVSLAAGMIYNAWLIDKVENHALEILFGVGTFYGIGLLSLCWKVKEGEYPPPEAETSGPPTVKSAVKTYFRECFSLPYYRWVIMASVVAGFSVVPFNIYGIFYAKSLNMDMDFYGKVSSLICLVSFVLSFFLGWFSDRFHPIRTGMVSMALQTVILFVGGRIATTESVFAWLFLVQGISIMSYNTLMASYAPRLFPREYFAQFNSAMMLINALASVIGAPLVGKFLDLTGNHYPHLFTIGGVIGLCGLGCFIMVYRGYRRYGGDSGYVAPDPTV